MTRVQQDLPLTVESYDSLDSAGKKRNMFMRTAEKLEKFVEMFALAQMAINEANEKIEAANKQCFQGNEELRATKDALSYMTERRDAYVLEVNQREAELASLKSKWYFKLFGR